MIIFGTKNITTSPEKGDFNCPSCATKQAFRHRRVRRFFHLYFIPLIPLNTLGEYVECKICKDTYDINVLNYDPQAVADKVEAEYQIAIKAVMIHILLADGVIDDAEVDMVAKTYLTLTEMRLSVRAVHEEIKRVKETKEELGTYLRQLATLNDDGKESVIKAAFMVAMADGKFQDEERDMISQIGKDLGMTKAHVRGVVSDLFNGH